MPKQTSLSLFSELCRFFSLFFGESFKNAKSTNDLTCKKTGPTHFADKPLTRHTVIQGKSSQPISTDFTHENSRNLIRIYPCAENCYISEWNLHSEF